MKKQVRTVKVVVCLVLLVAACRSRNESQTNDIAPYDTIENFVDTVGPGSGDAVDFVDCPRGTPERIVKTNVEPQPTFVLNRERNMVTESLQFQNGDRLEVRNGGCEYFVVTFRFETGRFSADTTDMIYWLNKSAVLVSEISDAIDAPLDFNDGVSAIKKTIRPEVRYEPGQEIVYAEGEIRQFTSLNRVQQLPASKYAVEVTFALGPL